MTIPVRINKNPQRTIGEGYSFRKIATQAGPRIISHRAIIDAF